LLAQKISHRDHRFCNFYKLEGPEEITSSILAAQCAEAFSAAEVMGARIDAHM